MLKLNKKKMKLKIISQKIFDLLSESMAFCIAKAIRRNKIGLKQFT